MLPTIHSAASRFRDFDLLIVMAALAPSAVVAKPATVKPQPDQTSNASPARISPNVVYIALEDITPMMGGYGDAYARTPMFRKAWSSYYDSVTQVDYRAGEIIDQLKEDGLWDDTIVIVWADHGVGMPRGKHTVFEMVRAIRDKRFCYQRNFYPNLPYKPFEDYEFGALVLIEWVKLARAGKLTGAMEMPAMRFKPVEELYDVESDPHMVKNLAGDPKYAKVLKLMRQRLDEWMIETVDLGVMAEAEVHKRAEGKIAHWDVGQELNNYEQILETANLQLQGQQAGAEITARSKPNGRVLGYAIAVSGDGKTWGNAIAKATYGFQKSDEAENHVPRADLQNCHQVRSDRRRLRRRPADLSDW